MSAITGKQIVALSRVFTDGDTSSQQVQELIDSGLLADLRDADLSTINRSDLRKFLGLPPINAKDFPTWKTVKLGAYETAEFYRRALKANEFKVSDWANDILDKPDFTVSREEKEVELVRLSVAELGFKKGATLSDIYSKADKLGLDPCDAEVGPALRLAYKDQPKSEWVVVAMKPIAGSYGYLYVFDVVRGGNELWLGTYHGGADDFCYADDLFVFVRRS
jgi:hypothetical protein